MSYAFLTNLASLNYTVLFFFTITYIYNVYISFTACSGTAPKPVSIPEDLFRYTLNRELGYPRTKHACQQIYANDYVSQLMPMLFREKEFRVGNINKIFSAQWLNSKQVVFGTKCNKVCLFVCLLYCQSV